MTLWPQWKGGQGLLENINLKLTCTNNIFVVCPEPFEEDPLLIRQTILKARHSLFPLWPTAGILWNQKEQISFRFYWEKKQKYFFNVLFIIRCIWTVLCLWPFLSHLLGHINGLSRYKSTAVFFNLLKVSEPLKLLCLYVKFVPISIFVQLCLTQKLCS
jgi:hypothetical protein